MQIILYNTLGREKQMFEPLDSDKVTMYSCGPTVYSIQHLGNLRAVFVVDLLRRVLTHVGGYSVDHIMNITDVWHLTDDGDHGEDKMEKGARKDGITAWDVAKKYTDIFLEDARYMDISIGTERGRYDIFMPRATDHIQQQIDMILDLESKWYTYIVEGDGVYMDTSKFSDYGALLSDKHLAGLEEGSRVDLKWKKNPTDFALWKFNMTGAKRDMEWESPWGVWFPGWHIECSAMATEYLGTEIDIHTGGMEHIPVHHTNEIAQAECSCGGHPWVRYRVHYQWLMMNGKKIAKSDGNVAYMSEVRERGYEGADVRMFFLQAQYRSFQDFSRESLEAAKKGRAKLSKRLRKGDKGWERVIKVDKELVEWAMELLADDLDTPKILARLFAVVESMDEDDDELRAAIKWLDDAILWLDLFSPEVIEEAPEEVQMLARQRREAKSHKDWDMADRLRDKIESLGWKMVDGKDSYDVEKI